SQGDQHDQFFRKFSGRAPSPPARTRTSSANPNPTRERGESFTRANPWQRLALAQHITTNSWNRITTTGTNSQKLARTATAPRQKNRAHTRFTPNRRQ